MFTPPIFNDLAEACGVRPFLPHLGCSIILIRAGSQRTAYSQSDGRREDCGYSVSCCFRAGPSRSCAITGASERMTITTAPLNFAELNYCCHFSFAAAAAAIAD